MKYAIRIIIWALFFGVVVYFGVILNQNIDYWLNSDASSGMVLSRLLANESKLFSSSWCYGHELYVLYLNVFYVPCFWLFKSWHVVRVVGTLLAWGVFFCSLFYLCQQLRLTHAFPLIGICILMPLTADYFYIVMCFTQYLPALIISCLTIAMAWQLGKAQRWWVRLVLALLLVPLAFFGGLSGVQLLWQLYLPLCGAAICCQLSTHQWRLSAFTLGIAVVACCGCVINIFVLPKYLDLLVFRFDFTNLSWNNLILIVDSLLAILGYQQGSAFAGKRLVGNLFCLVLVGLIIVSVFDVLFRKQRYYAEQKTMAHFFVIALILFLGLYLVTNVPFTIHYGYLLLFAVMPVVASFLMQLRLPLWSSATSNTLTKITVLTAFMAAYMVSGLLLWREQVRREHQSVTELQTIANCLVDGHYLNGYATYGQANVLTELSNGQIAVWCWQQPDPDTQDLTELDAVLPYAQPRAHADATPTGAIFLLFTAAENANYTLAKNVVALNPNILYQSSNYLVYGFGSYQSLKDALAAG